jgi:hypothetical protein
MHPAFERSLKQIVKPALEECGFTPRKTREFVLDGRGRIEFQLGVRFMAGKFTVNIIIGEQSHRIGQLRATRWTRLMDRMFGTKPSLLKGLLMPKDKWWPLAADQAGMDRTMKDVLERLLRDAVPRIRNPVSGLR